MEKESDSLRVSLPSLHKHVSPKPSNSHTPDISAYGSDMRRSLLVGVFAIIVELVLYFSNALSRFF